MQFPAAQQYTIPSVTISSGIDPIFCRTDRNLTFQQTQSLPRLAAPRAPRFNNRSLLGLSAVGAFCTSLSRVAYTLTDVAVQVTKTTHQTFTQHHQPILKTAPRLLTSSLPSAITPVVQKLPYQLLKSVPTKALTILLFEVATRYHLRNNHRNDAHKATLAATVGSLALVATYPLHFVYHASKSKLSASVMLSAVSRNPRHAFAGLAPALVANLPVVLADFAVYKQFRSSFDGRLKRQDQQRKHLAVSLAIAAIASKSLGTVVAEPFNVLTKNIVKDVVTKGVSRQSIRLSCCEMVWVKLNLTQVPFKDGWKSFQKKSWATAVSAVVNKDAQHYIKTIGTRSLIPVVEENKVENPEQSSC